MRAREWYIIESKQKREKEDQIRKERKEMYEKYLISDIGDDPCPIICFRDGYLELTPGGFKITILLDSSIPKDKQKKYINKLDLYHLCLDKIDKDLKNVRDTHTEKRHTAMNIAPFCHIAKAYINGAGTMLYVLFELKDNARNAFLDIMVDRAVKKQIKNVGKKDKIYIKKDKRKALRSHILFNFDLNTLKFKDKDLIVEDIIDILNRHYKDITKENVDKAIQYLLDNYSIINELKSFNLEEELALAAV